MAALAPLVRSTRGVCVCTTGSRLLRALLQTPGGMPESLFPVGSRYAQQFLLLQPGFSCLLCHLHHLFVISEVGTGLCSETGVSP